MPAALFFFLRIAFGILGHLWFHIHFRIICSSSVKDVMGILIGITLNLQIALGSMIILTLLSLPIQEHGIFSHFFILSSISFNNVLSFFFKIFIYLFIYLLFIYFGCTKSQLQHVGFLVAARGLLSCGMWTSQLRHVDFLVAACMWDLVP